MGRRIQLPQKVLDELKWKSEDYIKIEVKEQDKVEIKKVKKQVRLFCGT